VPQQHNADDDHSSAHEDHKTSADHNELAAAQEATA
jgi:hypothetical protein